MEQLQIILLFGLMFCTFASSQIICGDSYFEVDGRCFQANAATEVTWTEAEAECKDQGGNLAYLKDCGIFGNLVRALYREDVDDVAIGYWIGGKNLGENSWYWEDFTAMSLGVPFWGINQDGTFEPNQDGECVLLRKESRFYFSDENCGTPSAFLCEKDPILATEVPMFEEVEGQLDEMYSVENEN